MLLVSISQISLGLSIRLRVHVLRSDSGSITIGDPSTVGSVGDLHMELGLSIVVISVLASSSVASPGVLISMQSSGSSAVTVGLNPVNLNTESSHSRLSITISRLIETRSGNSPRRNSVDIGVDSSFGAREVDVVFHGSIQQVESGLGGGGTSSGDGPALIVDMGSSISSGDIIGTRAVGSMSGRADWGISGANRRAASAAAREAATSVVFIIRTWMLRSPRAIARTSSS